MSKAREERGPRDPFGASCVRVGCNRQRRRESPYCREHHTAPIILEEAAEVARRGPGVSAETLASRIRAVADATVHQDAAPLRQALIDLAAAAVVLAGEPQRLLSAEEAA